MRRGLACFLGILLASASARAVTLAAGDLLVADGGSVIRVDPLTGVQETVVSELGDLRGIAVTPTGAIYVATDVDVLRVDPTAMSATSLGVAFSDLRGIAVDAAGLIYLVDGDPDGPSVLGLDPGDSSLTPILVGEDWLSNPSDIVLDGAGVIYVSELDGGSLTAPASIVSIDGASVSQVTFLDNLSVPLGLAVDESGTLFVANSLPASLVAVDEFGVQTVASSAGLMRDTVAVSASPFGVFVADRGDGTRAASVLRILPGGVQEPVTLAGLLTQGGIVDLDVFPVPEPGVGTLLGLGLVGLALRRA
jgi:sugar lactone lactonase YvrE